MAYVNNGTSRSLRVSVNRTLGGVQVQGYPKTYNGQNYWGNPTYPTLTDTQFRQLSDSDFAFRYADFVAYVESIESGLDFNYDIVGDGAIKTDLTCLTTTTTTTTAAVVTPIYTIWYTTDNNDGFCDAPCRNEKYTLVQYASYPLNILYFYNTPELLPGDYYAPGAGTIGYTGSIYAQATHTADIAADGLLSNHSNC